MIKENLVEMFENSIKTNWEKMAFSDFKEKTMTFAEVGDRVAYLHQLFKKIGVKKQDKIALLGRNSSHWCVVYIAAVTYGAVIVPILPDFHKDDKHHIINHSDSILLFCAKKIYEELDTSLLKDIKGLLAIEDFSLLYSKKKSYVSYVEKAQNTYLENYNGSLTADNFKVETVENEDIAVIIYTSGTSGFSKGVVLPLRSLSSNVLFAQDRLPLKSGDKMVSFLPLAHVYGCSFDFLYPFSIGCHITLINKIPSPKILLDAFDQVKPNLIISVPLIIEKIYRKKIKPVLDKKAVQIMMKIPGLKKVLENKIKKGLMTAFGNNFLQIIVGGAPINDEVDAFLSKIGFPITNGYGMTECGPLISYSQWDETKVASVGKEIDRMEIKIDSEDPQKVIGEIMVKGDNVMLGYYKNKKDTKDCLDKEGWLRTGDLGIIDQDGFLFIKGRSKSMLLGPSGQNIYPEEIEARLNNLPYVLESIVIQRNNELIALVHPNFELMDEHNVDKADLENLMEKNRKLLNTQNPSYCRVSAVEIYSEEFEKTPKKSIKRYLYSGA